MSLDEAVLHHSKWSLSERERYVALVPDHLKIVDA